MSTRAVGYIKGLVVCPNGERISRMEKHVGMILADSHQDRASRRTFPSVEGMAEDAVMSDRHFQRMLASLEAKGVIRREYPDGVGRGKTTYYFFPELDEMPATQVSKKGDRVSPFTAVQIGIDLDAKGCQKGDRRVTSATPPYRNNKSNKDNKSKDTPQPPARRGSVDLKTGCEAAEKTERKAAIGRAADQVMQACGFSRPRLRKVLLRAIELRADSGENPPTVALAMINAWLAQIVQRDAGLLRAHFGPEKFFGDAHWRNPGGWHRDNAAIERQRESRVGMA